MNSSRRGPDGLGASSPPTRVAPPRRVRPEGIGLGGLFPRSYRQKLAAAEPFWGDSEYDAARVHYEAPSPVIGTAVHAHHRIREGLQPKLAMTPAQRYHEEDPETERFLGHLLHTVTPNQSRYEFDINRPPDTTVYATPDLAWGQQVWAEPLSQFEREFTLEKWYEFHTFMDCAVEDAIERFGYAVVFDFHSYNYQRQGYADWRADDRPVINLGTRHLNLDERGTRIKDWFFERIRGHTLLGESMLVQENGVFYGGYLNRRLSHLYGPRVITLSVEYKKVYMDERTGEVYQDVLRDLTSQMDETIRGLGDEFGMPLRARSKAPDLASGTYDPGRRELGGRWPADAIEEMA